LADILGNGRYPIIFKPGGIGNNPAADLDDNPLNMCKQSISHRRNLYQFYRVI